MSDIEKVDEILTKAEVFYLATSKIGRASCRERV